MKMRNPITDRATFDHMQWLAGQTKVSRENRHLILNFYSTYISSGYICQTCNDAIWSALIGLRQLASEHGPSILKAIEAEERKATKEAAKNLKSDLTEELTTKPKRNGHAEKEA